MALAAVLTLSACGSGGGGATTSPGPPPGTPQADATVGGVVTKGPLADATVRLYRLDGAGERADDVPLAQTSTDVSGAWSASVPAGSGALLVEVAGGVYVDEADPNPDPGARRTVELPPDEVFEAVLPAGAATAAVNLYTGALLAKARAETFVDDFAAVFEANRAQLTAALGFDPVTTVPADPIAPAAEASGAARSYALALGGAANAVNRIAIAAGRAAPDAATLVAFVSDLADCRLDGAGFSGAVRLAGLPLPQVDLNAEILRFRNNNFAAYAGVLPPALDETACAAYAGAPDPVAPVFAQVPAPLTVAAVDAAGIPLDAPELRALLEAVAVVDDRGGPVALSNDAPQVLPLGMTTITLTARDAAGNTATATLSVTVADQAPPVITAPADLRVDASGPLTDVVLGEPTVADNVTPQAELVVVNDAPAGGFGAGVTVVTWTVTDAAGLSASATQTVTVQNAPPVLVAAPADLTLTEGLAFSADLGGSFADPDSELGFSLTGLPAGTGIGLDAATGVLAGIPTDADARASPLSLTVTARDEVNAAAATLAVVVTDVNNPPRFATSGDLALLEDFPATAVIMVTPDATNDDPPGSVSYDLSPDPAGIDFALVRIDADTGQVQVDAIPDASGTALLTITADDGQSVNALFSATVRLTVAAVNDPPAFRLSGDLSLPLNFNGVRTVTVQPDPVPADEVVQTVTYGLAPAVDFAFVDIDEAGGTVSVRSIDGATGSATLTVTADDGQAQNARFSASFTLTVQPLNQRPLLERPIEDVLGYVYEAMQIDLSDYFVDPDGDELDFAAQNLPPSLILADGILEGVPQPVDARVGEFFVEVTATDEEGASTTAPFVLSVQWRDTDGDGLADAEEAAHGTAVDRADSDDDGVSDALEVRAGGDPLVAAASVLRIGGGDRRFHPDYIPPGSSATDPSYVLYEGDVTGALVLTAPCDHVVLIGVDGRPVLSAQPATPVSTATAAVTVEGCENVQLHRLAVIDGRDSGVVVRGSQVLLNDVVVRDNVGRSGGGVRVDSGSLTVVDSVLAANRSSGDGGAVWVSADAQDVRIEHTVISANVAAGAGGGLYASLPGSGLSVFNGLLLANRADSGGGLALGGGAPPALANLTVVYNDGGAIWPAGTSVDFVDSIFHANPGAAQGDAGPPSFTAGFYLDQERSPAVDGGVNDAVLAGLSDRFTDADPVAPRTDRGPVDRGFHYAAPHRGAADAVEVRPSRRGAVVAPTHRGRRLGKGHLVVAARADGSRTWILPDLGDGEYRLGRDDAALVLTVDGVAVPLD